MIEGTGSFASLHSPSSLPRRTISLTKGQRNPRNKRKQKGRCTLRFAASDGFESEGEIRSMLEKNLEEISIDKVNVNPMFLEKNIRKKFFFQNRINKWNFLLINFETFSFFFSWNFYVWMWFVWCINLSMFI